MIEKQFEMLDTFQDFLDYWAYASTKTLDKQIRLWQTSYMNEYPELLDKQVQCYKIENKDWQDIARKVFPTFPRRLRLMQRARNNILDSCELICEQAWKKLEVDFDIILVVYVGIGCGAGWATTYGDRPAILLGLENIAEEKWHTKTGLRGLISHEIGHLAHRTWRDEWVTFEEEKPGPLFQLYSEGFAQRCEHLIIGKGAWHMAPDKEWIPWCEQNKGWLASAPLLLRLASSTFGGFISTIQLPANFLILGIVYFVLGYSLFAALSAGIGAISPNAREGQQLSMIYTMLTFVPLWFSSLLFIFPNSPIWVVLTIFPVTAPMTVMLRLGVSDIAVWELAVSITVLVLSIIGILFLAVRAFRIYLLMYGKRPNWREIIQNLRSG